MKARSLAFCRYAPMGDIAVIEGVMGMFDGEQGSAVLAGYLGVPVILVVDAYGMAESAAALVHGYTTWAANSGVSLVGVIFNRVGSERHYERLKTAVTGVEVLGFLPRTDEGEIASRHLGLTTAEETPLTRVQVEALAALVEKHLDIDRLITLSEMTVEPCERILGRGGKIPVTVRIAVARDVAFSFYYEENLDLLREAGADIVTFSPLWDAALPNDVHALFIGGGYPELNAERLSANESMRTSIAEFIASGKPSMPSAEDSCISPGEFTIMRAGSSDGRCLAFATRMMARRVRLGYREIIFRENCILGHAGSTLRGHEFHYSEIASGATDTKTVYSVADAQGADLPPEGYASDAVLASYIHVHFGSNPRTARNFVNYIKEKLWKK